MSIKDPKPSPNETDPKEDDNPGRKPGASEDEAQSEPLKRFIWTEGDFEFEDDEA